MQETYKNYATEELVVMYQSSHNESYLQEIIRRNKGLLHKWVQSYSNIPFYDMEDLLEEGYVALWKAVEHFETDRGYTFSSCLKGYIKQCFNHLYTEVTRKKRYTGSTAVSWEELIEINRETSIEDNYLEYIELEELLGSLDGKLKTIAIYLYNGYSKFEISKLLGITPATTSYYIKRLRSFVTKHYAV